MTKQRHYYYISGKSENGQLEYTKRIIYCDDRFEDDLVMLAFPISLMKDISSILKNFKLRDDAEFFYSECREIVSVPEKHVNEKGEGKLTFQSYFHRFPDSVSHFFDDAIVVVVLHPHGRFNDEGLQDYNMIGYIHANIISFKNADDEVLQGYYYNVLRMSEATVNGEAIYRRKRIFTTVFSVLLDIVIINDVHFVYANMGRENQSILDALKMNSKRTGKLYETFPMRNNTHVNLLLGRKKHAAALTDISHNEELLRAYYAMIHETRQNYVYYQLHNERLFFNMVNRILGSSPNSRFYALLDNAGKIDAAGFFVCWADYMYLKLQNPKGLFKVIDQLKITDKLLYATLFTGKPEHVKKLIQGAAYLYRKEHGIQLTVLNAHDGDPYSELKKSVIYDPFVYFTIYDRAEMYEKMKNRSKDEKGNVRIFIETPML
ncbi:MAG: hypothetical protein NZM35_01600 [Chitinophagales bacterium]|nr:hypothetical protein [Chitinophagales bacterium]MDW8418198.1 hypothetical protein [Chitinophagales bacterium]